MVLLRHSYWGYTALFPEKTTIFGAPQLKKGPHRRFGGSKFVADFKLWKYGIKRCFSFFRFVVSIFIRKMRRLCQNFTNPFKIRFWPHILFVMIEMTWKMARAFFGFEGILKIWWTIPICRARDELRLSHRDSSVARAVAFIRIGREREKRAANFR